MLRIDLSILCSRNEPQLEPRRPEVDRQLVNYERSRLCHDCRSGRCVGGASVRRRDSRRDPRGERLHDRTLDREHDLRHDPSSCGRRCKQQDWWRSHLAHAPRHSQRWSDGADGRRASSRRGLHA